MSRSSFRHSDRLRVAVWVAGTLLAAGYFLSRSEHRAVRTPVGVERYLFPGGDSPVYLLENPSGGRWILAVRPEGPAPPRSSPLVTAAESFTWAPHFRRSERPFGREGTWLMEGAQLHRVWKRWAGSWLDDQHLLGDAEGTSVSQVLDLGSGRVFVRNRAEEVFGDAMAARPADAEESLREYDFEAPPWVETERTPDTPNMAAPGLDEWLPSEVSHPKWCQVGNRKVILCEATGSQGVRPGLYAVSDDYAPRTRRLTSLATPLAVSRDGRTMFLLRRGSVWRLDLSAPLPELLDEQRTPELPDPPGVSP